MLKTIKEKPMHPETLTGKILIFLCGMKGRWCTSGTCFYMPSVQQVFPVGTSHKEQKKFMQKLQKDGLVSGCDCGCRGDYTPTKKGLEYIENESDSGAQIAQEYRKGNYGYGY